MGLSDGTSCAMAGLTMPIRAIICANFFNFTRLSLVVLLRLLSWGVSVTVK
jgi:hypothetical protein